MKRWYDIQIKLLVCATCKKNIMLFNVRCRIWEEKKNYLKIKIFFLLFRNPEFLQHRVDGGSCIEPKQQQ